MNKESLFVLYIEDEQESLKGILVFDGHDFHTRKYKGQIFSELKELFAYFTQVAMDLNKKSCVFLSNRQFNQALLNQNDNENFHRSVFEKYGTKVSVPSSQSGSIFKKIFR